MCLSKHDDGLEDFSYGVGVVLGVNGYGRCNRQTKEEISER